MRQFCHTSLCRAPAGRHTRSEREHKTPGQGHSPGVARPSCENADAIPPIDLPFFPGRGAAPNPCPAAKIKICSRRSTHPQDRVGRASRLSLRFAGIHNIVYIRCVHKIQNYADCRKALAIGSLAVYSYRNESVRPTHTASRRVFFCPFGRGRVLPGDPAVTPLAGAWIEIKATPKIAAKARVSHSSRVRGLKSRISRSQTARSFWHSGPGP